MSKIEITDHGKVRLITINRPERSNAVDRQSALDLQAAFQEFEASDMRVAVLTGAGEKAFSAGADIKDPPEIWRIMPTVGFESEKPIICAVHGWCIGGALMTMVMSDLCVADATARFSYPEARVGVTGGVAAALAARIPHKIAMELLMMGKPISADRALEVGLINQVVEKGKHVDTALEMGQELSQMAPMVLRTIKRFVSRTLPKSPSELMLAAQIEIGTIWASADKKEGEDAFLEKRAPVFVGQ
ncbi:enoyl-CoA hydratase/isomerase family protein [Oryzicola mucosus]|uniref:Enoyl-CoA hydratase/isomerase family protein n=1 Tax=Oryzicola mucosus TaxID=2767425 RepID=A0A8J6PVW8_9HYPH|nr:enoyl-CoA hydratase-related protein [Oryzicola mucosus]MBD0417074.1 enoyl-CoA hydratase/isomerase family protein [Oryzicola mucosus]